MIFIYSKLISIEEKIDMTGIISLIELTISANYTDLEFLKDMFVILTNTN